MSDNSSRKTGILVIAAIFGIVALLVAWFGYDFRFIGSFIIGLIVAAIVYFLLMMGWKEPAGHGAAASQASSSDSSTTQASASAPAAEAAAPAAAVASAPVAEPEPAAAPEPAAKPAAAKKPAAKKPAAKKPAAKKPAAKKPAAKKAADKPKSTARPVAPDGKPELLKKARAGGADDLKQIKGVGPKMEKMLNDLGVYHFDQVAGWRKKEVQWVDDNLEGFNGRIERDEWVKQAKVLAKGGTTAFSKKVQKGGVY